MRSRGMAFRAASHRRSGVALAGFRQIDDDTGDCIAGRLNVSLTVQGCDGSLESNPHETRSLGIESVTFQIGSDWHGSEI